jgi:hypothetical protein
MADELNAEMGPDFNSEPLANGEDTAPQAGVLSQYVKDLSFENPNAPAVYQWQGRPVQHWLDSARGRRFRGRVENRRESDCGGQNCIPG